MVAQLRNADGDLVISGRDIQVPYSLSGSATEGIDYSVTASPLVIPAGVSSEEIAITVIDDVAYEPDETVEVVMDARKCNRGAITTHFATISDDDAPPFVSFILESQTMAETVGMALVTVQMRDLLGNETTAGMDISIPFLSSGTASADTDFTISPSPLIIPAGNSRADIVVYFEIDDVAEPDETVVVTLGGPEHASWDPRPTTRLRLRTSPRCSIHWHPAM